VLVSRESVYTLSAGEDASRRLSVVPSRWSTR
jgi:hypothetical protein